MKSCKKSSVRPDMYSVFADEMIGAKTKSMMVRSIRKFSQYGCPSGTKLPTNSGKLSTTFVQL